MLFDLNYFTDFVQKELSLFKLLTHFQGYVNLGNETISSPFIENFLSYFSVSKNEFLAFLLILESSGHVRSLPFGGFRINCMFSFRLRREINLKEQKEILLLFLNYYELYACWLAEQADLPEKHPNITYLLQAESENLKYVVDVQARIGKSLEGSLHVLDHILILEQRNGERLHLFTNLIHRYEEKTKAELQGQAALEYLEILEKKIILLRNLGRVEECSGLITKALANLEWIAKGDAVMDTQEEIEKLIRAAYIILLRQNARILFVGGKHHQQVEAFFRKAVTISNSLAISELRADSWRDLARFYLAVGNEEESRDCFASALWLSRHDAYRVAVVYSDLGRLMDNHDQPQSALNYYSLAIVNFKQIGGQKALAQTWQNIALVLEKMDFINDARQAYQRAISFFITTSDTFGEAQIYQNLASLELDLRNPVAAKQYLLRAQHIYTALNRSDLLAEIFQNLGEIYRRTGNLLDSIKANQRALELYEFINNTLGCATVFQNIGNTYLLKGEFNSARKYYLEALTIFKAKQLGFREGGIYQNLAGLTHREGKERATNEYLKRALYTYLRFSDNITQLGRFVVAANRIAADRNDKKMLAELDDILLQHLDSEQYALVIASARKSFQLLIHSNLDFK